MSARLYVAHPTGLVEGLELELPESVSRHVQVLRLQPQDVVTVFDGRGGEWDASILSMGRKVVQIAVQTHRATHRELPQEVTLALGMPANDRMDGIVEKATELGVHRIQPLMCERSVLRLDGDRAHKKVAHWQGVAIAAAEQCGRTTVPHIEPVKTFATWMNEQHTTRAQRGLLSLQESIGVLDWARSMPESSAPVYFLSGPEGGLSPNEEQSALQSGWQAVSLGARTLRADTAPLMALGVLAAHWAK